MSLPTNNVASLDGKNKIEMMRKIHEKTKLATERRNRKVSLKRNKGQKQVFFEPRDLVWIHMCKERFPSKRESKLHPRG